jgi:hypothetical protein
VHAPAVLLRNQARETVIRVGQNRIQAARRAGQAILEAEGTASTNARAPVELSTLQNEIAQGNLDLSEPIALQLTDFEKTQNNNDWRAYRERNAGLAKHRGQT